MNYIKDTKKEETKRLVVNNSLIKKDESFYFLDKIQKILKAVYLLTDIFPETEVLKFSLRKKTLEANEALMEFYFSQAKNKIPLIHLDIYFLSLINYFDIALSLGFISQMNYNIISGEIKQLQKNIKNFSKNESFLKISLDDIFLSNNGETQKENTGESEYLVSFEKKDIQKKQEEKTINKKEVKISKQKDKKISKKDKRHADILSILAQKKDASVKDISTLFKDYSDKTIQRDLNILIAQKKVVKRGDKRWSTYRLKK